MYVSLMPLILIVVMKNMVFRYKSTVNRYDLVKYQEILRDSFDYLMALRPETRVDSLVLDKLKFWVMLESEAVKIALKELACE